MSSMRPRHSLISRVAVRGQERGRRRQQLLGSLLGDPVAAVGKDHALHVGHRTRHRAGDALTCALRSDDRQQGMVSRRNFWAIGMPVSVPDRANRVWPSASSSATRSPVRVPCRTRRGACRTARSRAGRRRWLRSPGPAPASASAWAYQVRGQPCTSRSGGPSPPMTSCMRRSRASTHRLVNESVKPSTRFAAPETDQALRRGR